MAPADLTRRDALRGGTAMGLLFASYGAAPSPTVAINSIGTQTEAASFAVSGAYTVAAPSGMTCSFSIGGGSTSVSGFSASGGTWSGTVTAPGQTGSTTLEVTGTGANTASATSNSFSLAASGGSFASFTLTGTSGSTQTNAVVELALPMAPGVLSAGSAVSMSGPSGISATQADLTITDKQSNIRWQKIAAVIPSLTNSSQSVTLTAASGSSATGTAIQPADLLNSSYHVGGTGNDNFECLISCTFSSGTVYTASARAGLGASSTWTYGAAQYVAAVRSGPFISEFVCRVPLAAGGTADPYLLAEFHITAAKAGAGAINDSTNPILWTNTQVLLYNGYIVQSSQVGGSPVTASQAPKVFDLEIQNGLNSPTTVYQLNGGVGSEPISLVSSNLGSNLWGGVQTRDTSNDFITAIFGGSSTVSVAPSSSLTTAEGTWTWGASTSGGYQTLLNGSSTNGGAGIELVIGSDSNLYLWSYYAGNGTYAWWVWNNSSSTWVSSSDGPPIATSWAPKTWGTNGAPGTTAGDNSNDCGKAIVELSGSATGLGWILDAGPVSTGVPLTSGQIGMLVPEDHAFSSTLVTSWKKMGVFLAYGSRLQPYAKFAQGTVPQYTAVITAAYILATQMVPNFAATAAQAPITNYEGPLFDGSHPLSAAIAAGAESRSFAFYEEQTGLTDAIGVFPESQTAALLNWDANYSLAYEVMMAQGQVTSIKNIWFLDEFQGTLAGPDKSIAYCITYGGVAQNVTYAGTTSPWSFAPSHSGDASYLPWLLTGDLCHLQGKIAMSIFYGQVNNYEGLLFGDLGNGGYSINSSGTPSTVFTLSAGTLPYTQGECVVLRNGTGGGYLPSPGIYFILPLSSTTFSVYDTYAHAMAAGSTGLQTLNNAGGGYLSDGFDYSYISSAWQVYGIRYAAWQYRTQAQTAASIPDSISEAFVGIFNTQAQHRRWLSRFDLYNYETFTSNSNFVALGPRWTVVQYNNPAYGEWHMNYYRIAAVNANEALNPTSSDNQYTYFIWMLHSPIQSVINSNVAPGVISCSEYISPCNASGSVNGYSWSQFWLDIMDYSSMRTNPNIPPSSGTMTVTGSSQTALTFSSTVPLWDASNPAQHVGSFFFTSTSLCEITSLVSDSEIVVDATWSESGGIPTHSGGATQPTGAFSFSPTSGTLFPTPPPSTDSSLYGSNYYSYTGQQTSNGTNTYGAMARTSIEIEDQYLSEVGETSANYNNAVSWFDANNYPDPYDPGGPNGIFQVNYLIKSRS